jgi:hypothetical protein
MAGETRTAGLRSCLFALVLSAASFAATLSVVHRPVQGATTRPTGANPLPTEIAEAIPKRLWLAPFVDSTPTPSPMIRLASEPAGAVVTDPHGRAIGRTPLVLRMSIDRPRADFVIGHDGYREKHISLKFRNQSVLAILARSSVESSNRQIARSHAWRAGSR